jgi:glycosyltransferase involved in cell wall biosynthesis
MTAEPRVSIAMATYNGARFIREQLDSFAAQTLLPDELVVCDDGSTDATVDIVETFASKAPFSVKVYRNPEHLDFTRNFEKAFSLCSGDIVFFSDQDDVWFPRRIQKIVSEFAMCPNLMVIVNNQILTDAVLRSSGLTPLDHLKCIGKDSDGLVEGCATALRRSWGAVLFPMPLEASPFVLSRSLSHDTWLHKFSRLLNLRSVIEEPLQFRRRTGSNATSWIASHARPIGLRDLAKERKRVAPSEAWHRQLAIVMVYERHLQTHRAELGGDFHAALKALQHERQSVERRLALAQLSLPNRIPAVWRLWRAGGYRHFERWLSAMNDLLRRG